MEMDVHKLADNNLDTFALSKTEAKYQPVLKNNKSKFNTYTQRKT